MAFDLSVNRGAFLSGCGGERRGIAERAFAETFPVHAEDSYVIIET
ncbi:hypothetical protein GWE18_35920 [Bradyrhizobium sp. CSA112]|nr:hypothetical protein [Bradyrhizobium sp. CSA112]MDE5458106.1 hypothetical protein [Bradyrhizobium sp. CSA112]